MATTTDARADSEKIAHADRRLLADWDRQHAIDDWFNASLEMQRSYLDWVSATVKVFFPQLAHRN